MLRAQTVVFVGSISWLMAASAFGQTTTTPWGPVRAPVWSAHRTDHPSQPLGEQAVPGVAQAAPITDFLTPPAAPFGGPIVARPAQPGWAAPAPVRRPASAYPPPLVAPTDSRPGAERSSFPVMIGDLWAGTQPIVTFTVDHAFHTTGTIIAGSPGSPNSLVAFERDAMGFANDFTSIPTTGRDATGDGHADTFAMTEPLPPNEVPTSPGPGFRYDGGTVVYTNSPTETTAQNGAYQDDQLWYAAYSYSQTLELPSAGGVSVWRAKVSENNSPLPADRLYFDYRFARHAPGQLEDLSRYVLGFEKTFHRGLGSIDIRIPYAYTAESEQFSGEPTLRGMEFGNLSLILKHVIFVGDTTVLSGGTGVSLPTGQDTRLSLADGTPVLLIDNEAVYLQPFVAAFGTPNERLFWQSFLEVDLDVTGNPVHADVQGGRLPRIGELHDATRLLADVGGGFWLYQNCNSRDVAIVRGIAVLGELHYATTLEDMNSVSGNGVTVADRARRYNVLNATSGLHGIFLDHLTFTGGLSFPLREGNDKLFDFQAAFLVNWYF